MLLAERIPNEQAIGLSPTIGWLLLACALCVVAIFVAQGDRWRRWWLTREDPRSLSLFRIVFAFLVICNTNDWWEYFEYLFSDEGIFTADVARRVFARDQFAGYGDGFPDGDPKGFFDLAAVLSFLKGPKYSLLYFWDSPRFMWAYIVVFELITVLFMIGYHTRLMGVLVWFGMNGLLYRNHLHWEGCEVVFRCMLAYLVVSRSGHAYSVDNWLRCRKLRRQGRLSVPGGPGGGAGLAPCDAHPRGLEAIYRRVPAWPRRLMMLQLATLYLTTGLVKTGSVWTRGDSLYYALNLDHFYRLPPQFVSSLVGTTLFRAMTWAVKIGQSTFALVIFGLVVRWAIRENFPPLTRARTWVVRGAWATAVVLAGAIAYVAWPVHYTPKIPREAFLGGWIGLGALLTWFWWRLGHRPFRIGNVTIDRWWLCTWVLGRRIYLVWHIAFHAHLVTLISVGQFQTVMLSATIPFLTGREVAEIGRLVGRRLARIGMPFIPADVAAGAPPVPSEDPTLPHLPRDAAGVPTWAQLVALAVVVVGIVVQVTVGPAWDYRLLWLLAPAVVVGSAVLARRRGLGHRLPDQDPHSGRTPPPWAYGPIGRAVIGSLIVWHLSAVAAWLMPDKDSLKAFRPSARAAVSRWLRTTTTDQGWNMFAPNPPRSNVFLKVLVTDPAGEVWDMRTDVYAEENKPIPWIWNTRLRKMNRRIIGGESGPTDWYRKWHARYYCRKWALDHGGETPQKVELVRVSYRIPSPEEVHDKGYYVAEDLLRRTAREELEHTEYCENAIMGQLPDHVRQRHGLPPLPQSTPYRPWRKNKKARWDRQRERARKAREARAGHGGEAAAVARKHGH